MRKLILGALLLMVPGGVFAQGAKPAATPVLISSDEECRLNVDGEDLGTVPAGGIKKIGLVPGEHLVSAVCPGDRRWKSTVTVGSEQKIVSIPSREAAAATAPGGSPAAVSGTDGNTGIASARQLQGRWTITAVVKDSAAHRGGIHPGSILLAVDGQRAKDKTVEQLMGLDRGVSGSIVSVEFLDRDDKTERVALTRAPFPRSGTMEVLQLDGKTFRDVAYDEKTADAVAAGPTDWNKLGFTVSPPSAGATRTCQGYATPCGQRGTYNCMLGAGCFSGVGGCTGTPIMNSCFGKSQYACATIQGCFWVYNSCSGTASCSGFANQWACQVVLGCQWSDACTGFATPCESLTQFTCALQPGCMFR